MELLDTFYLSDVLHVISSDLLIPVVVLLLVFIVYSLYSIGSVLVEVFVERRHYRAHVPQLVAKLEAAEFDELVGVIDESGLLRNQKDDLEELVSYLYLPEDARTEVAKRLLANEELELQKAVGRTDIAAKVAPMLGLMGTLIPLGPGIVALSSGDTETLSSALLMAFDTTVAGLATAVVCYVISRMRRRWYSDYLVSMEAAFNTLLEKGRLAHEAGHKFERVVLAYDKAGRTAKREPLAGVGKTGRAAKGVAKADKAVAVDAAAKDTPAKGAGVSPSAVFSAGTGE